MYNIWIVAACVYVVILSATFVSEILADEHDEYGQYLMRNSTARFMFLIVILTWPYMLAKVTRRHTPVYESKGEWGHIGVEA